MRGFSRRRLLLILKVSLRQPDRPPSALRRGRGLPLNAIPLLKAASLRRGPRLRRGHLLHPVLLRKTAEN